MKVLVCGSRRWTKRAPIERELLKILPDGIVVHGAHWEGADDMADTVAMGLGLEVRRYPALWILYGPSAGPRRNAEMLRKEHVAAEPIGLCLAFAEDFSKAFGTSDMRRKAIAAGIRVESFSA
jgi:YspA, cpYpsA-related SLOG family